MSNYPYQSNNSSREVMVKNATQGAFAVAGGVALLIFKFIAGLPVVGAIVGAAMLVAGIFMRGKGSSADRMSSLALIGLGSVSTLSALNFIPVLSDLASGLMGASAVGLIGFGIYKLWQYRKAMKARG